MRLVIVLCPEPTPPPLLPCPALQSVGGRPIAVDWAVAKSQYEAANKAEGDTEVEGGGASKAQGSDADDEDDEED